MYGGTKAVLVCLGWKMYSYGIKAFCIQAVAVHQGGSFP